MSVITAFTTAYEVDKIVKVFTGSYTSAEPTARVGNLATIYVKTIPHGLTRPVLCDLLWSSDGSTWYDGGGSKLAFSDSSNIYIFDGYAPSGTVYYKVYCTWIDNFDTTDPLVDVSQYNDAPVQFDSRLNYPKLKTAQTLTFSASSGEETQSISHNLGYAPNVRVWFEAFSGEVWPLNAGGASNFFDYATTQEECYISIDTTNVSVTMTHNSGSSKRAWVRIYYDAA